jgi:hypothetical protein
MDTFTSSADPLDQEIAAKDADVARSQASISDVESQLLSMKHALEVLTVEVKTLKRAAGLRPATGSHSVVSQVAAPPSVAPRSFAQPVEAPAPAAQQAGRFRDVVDQIRAGR